MKVSVLTPVLDEEASIRDVVAQMQRQRIDEGGIEFIFVDGSSSDRTREILLEMAGADSRIRILDNPARRTPNGLNIGLRNATGDYIARMDAHTLYPPDYLVLGIKRLDRGDCESVSGPQTPRGTGIWSRRIGIALRSPLGVGGAKFRNATEEVEVDTGFTGMWRRETLEAHGGWDEGWPKNQDAELSARIRESGGRIICVPEMAALYSPRESLPDLWRQYFDYGRYRAKTARRHPTSMRRSHVLAPGVVVAAAAALIPHGIIARLARRSLGIYATALCLAAAGKMSEAGVRDASALPLVWATMHFAWGFGFIAGSARFGVPTRALAHVVRLP